MTITFSGIPSSAADQARKGAPDAYGNKPESFVCESDDLECRHCGENIGIGETVLLLAYSPFSHTQPFAETGPILLHEKACDSYGDRAEAQPAIKSIATRLVRGYDKDERIVYGTGTQVETQHLETACQDILNDSRVEFLHIRSSTNNCWQGRVDRSE